MITNINRMISYQKKKIRISLGYYVSLNDIIKVITYQTFGDRISIGFNKHTKKVKFTLKK